MYNGIGLRTVRGSGTNGYVQKNLSYVRAAHVRNAIERNTDVDDFKKLPNDLKTKPPNAEILEHAKKRQIELKLFELSEAMNDQGYTEDEIAEKVKELREKLQSVKDSSSAFSATKISTETESHLLAIQKEEENVRMKEAFGIGNDFEAGASFNREVQEQKKLARIAAREEREKEREALQEKKRIAWDAERQEREKQRAREDEQSRNRERNRVQRRSPERRRYNNFGRRSRSRDFRKPVRRSRSRSRSSRRTGSRWSRSRDNAANNTKSRQPRRSRSESPAKKKRRRERSSSSSSSSSRSSSSSSSESQRRRSSSRSSSSSRSRSSSSSSRS